MCGSVAIRAAKLRRGERSGAETRIRQFADAERRVVTMTIPHRRLGELLVLVRQRTARVLFQLACEQRRDFLRRPVSARNTERAGVKPH